MPVDGNARMRLPPHLTHLDRDGDAFRREYNRSKAEAVWTDRSQTHNVGLGLHDRATAAEIVGGATGWRRYENAVAGHSRQLHIVYEDIKGGHAAIVSTRD